MINGFVSDGEGVRISGSQNVVTGSYIGLDPTGAAAVPNRFNGVSIDTGTGNRIGGRTAPERNVISGNQANGLHSFGIGSGGNVVEGNFIGTDRTGTVDIGNGVEGVLLDLGAPNTVIRGNVVSGNGAFGVFIRGDGNTVQGNLVGTDATGTAPLGNDSGGVILRASPNSEDADGNRITLNVVSANAFGVQFASDAGFNVEADDNLVLYNLIGTDAKGKVAPGMGNSNVGVLYRNRGTGNVIARNVIAGNGATAQSAGVGILGDGSAVELNEVFRNLGQGIDVGSGSGNIIRRNRLRENGKDGIFLGFTTSSNSIVENFLRANLEHDCHDNSTGSGTAGTANTWRGNNGQTSQPPGLCVPGG